MGLLRKFFKRSAGKGLDLISIHVPKTAGHSFLVILEGVYKKKVQLLYGNEEGMAAISNGDLPPVIPGSRVIHGHFPATLALRQGYPDAKLVAWVREPVARIISYYHFWRRIEKHGNPNHDYFLDNDFSLTEFAGLDFMKNEMLYYFRQIPMESFDFIGMVAYFNTDIRLLAEKMDWRIPEIPFVNSSSKKEAIDDKQLGELENILADEIRFYNRVKKMRGRH